MNTKTKCVLVADTRERHVYRHQKEFENHRIEIKQITTGDYVILSPTMQILAVIERKSLEDFSASLKDGRHSNKDKLTKLREQTNCRIIFIIEGPLEAAPNDCFGNIPYKHIESSIFHLIIRDNVCVLRTKNDLDTAKTLSRFMISMDTLCENFELSEPTVSIDANDITDIKEDVVEFDVNPNKEITVVKEITLNDQLKLLTEVHQVSDHDLVRVLWSCFPGIAVTYADDFMKHWSIADIISGRITEQTISAHKSSTGRKISKKVIESLTNINKIVSVRLLAAIPGISRPTAAAILDQFTLKSILSWGIGSIGMIVISRGEKIKSKRLGDKIAERLLRLFNYKYV